VLRQGIKPKVVQERLRHRDITLTLNTYSHALPDTEEEAVQNLDIVLAPKQPQSKSDAAQLPTDIRYLEENRERE